MSKSQSEFASPKKLCRALHSALVSALVSRAVKEHFAKFSQFTVSEEGLYWDVLLVQGPTSAFTIKNLLGYYLS